MTKTQPVVFLFDVDNTLLENDSVQAHLKEHLEQAYGVEARAERSGVWRAVDDRVLIYIYKECELEYVAQLYPSDHYVLIDDKLRVLAAAKKIWVKRVTTAFPKQGHYASDPDIMAQYPSADMELAKIRDLLNCDLAFLKKH